MATPVAIIGDAIGFLELDRGIAEAVVAEVNFGDLMEPGGSWSWRRCLGPGVYTLRIRDSWGDGTCCFFGDGDWSTSMDGEITAAGDGDHGDGVSVELRANVDGATEAPEPPPPTPPTCDTPATAASPTTTASTTTASTATAASAARRALLLPESR